VANDEYLKGSTVIGSNIALNSSNVTQLNAISSDNLASILQELSSISDSLNLVDMSEKDRDLTELLIESIRNDLSNNDVSTLKSKIQKLVSFIESSAKLASICSTAVVAIRKLIISI